MSLVSRTLATRENTDQSFKQRIRNVSRFSVYWNCRHWAMAAAYAFRAKEMPSLISCWMAAKVMVGVSDVDVLLGGIISTTDDTGYEDRDNDANDGDGDEIKYERGLPL
ncbi:hypothetical protein Tco_1105564 [Tanacetum coccineum]